LRALQLWLLCRAAVPLSLVRILILGHRWTNSGSQGAYCGKTGNAADLHLGNMLQLCGSKSLRSHRRLLASRKSELDTNRVPKPAVNLASCACPRPCRVGLADGVHCYNTCGQKVWQSGLAKKLQSSRLPEQAETSSSSSSDSDSSRESANALAFALRQAPCGDATLAAAVVMFTAASSWHMKILRHLTLRTL